MIDARAAALASPNVRKLQSSVLVRSLRLIAIAVLDAVCAFPPAKPMLEASSEEL